MAHSYSAATDEEDYTMDDDSDEEETDDTTDPSGFARAWSMIKNAFVVIANVESKCLAFSGDTPFACYSFLES